MCITVLSHLPSTFLDYIGSTEQYHMQGGPANYTCLCNGIRNVPCAYLISLTSSYHQRNGSRIVSNKSFFHYPVYLVWLIRCLNSNRCIISSISKRHILMHTLCESNNIKCLLRFHNICVLRFPIDCNFSFIC